MNDTTSHSLQFRRGARRGLALLASAAIVASMTAAASAENGPSDEDIISRSAWGVYNTSRVFEPWAEIPLSFDPGSPMTDVRLGTPAPKCEARAAGYWASYALEEGMIPGVMAPFGYKQNPTLARAANPPYAGSYGDAPVESEVAPAGKDAGPYYHASCPTPLAGKATARHFHLSGQGFSIGAATTDTEQHFEPAQHLVSEYGVEITAIITDTIERWDAEEASRRIELHVGRDLQFIRINGTVVGSLAGLVIYAVAQLLF